MGSLFALRKAEFVTNWKKKEFGPFPPREPNWRD